MLRLRENPAYAKRAFIEPMYSCTGRTQFAQEAPTVQIIRHTLRIMGTLWALPNSLIGLVYGGGGLLAGAQLEWDASGGILRFVEMPSWLMPTAMSLGHVQVYAVGRCRAANGTPAANRFGVPVVIEETLHTRQAEVLGPLYLPLHGLCMLGSVVTGGGTHDHNLLEMGPERGLGPWPWHARKNLALPCNAAAGLRDGAGTASSCV